MPKKGSSPRTDTQVAAGPRATNPAWARLDLGKLSVAVAAGAVTYAATSRGLMVFGGVWQMPLFVGVVVGLVSLVPLQGAVVSVVCVLGGMLLAPPESFLGAPPGATAFVVAAILAPLGGVAAGLARSRVGGSQRRVLNLAISAVLVCWILVNLWIPLSAAGLPPKAFGPLQAGMVSPAPLVGQYSDDQGLYRRVFALMHEGRSYYSAYNEAWQGISNGPAPPNSPFGVRLPTYYWLWKVLPYDPFAIVYVFLAFASLAVVASAFIAGQLAGPRLAPLAAVAVAAFTLEVGYSTYVVYVDIPAAAVALAGIAAFLFASRTRRMSTLWIAVGMLTVAALTREILAYLLALAALSALLEPQGERLRRAVPWIAGLGVFAVGYAAHTAAAWPYIRLGSGSVSYLKGGFAYLIDGFDFFAGSFTGYGATVAVLVLLGLVGALASKRRSGGAFAAFAFAAVAVPLLIMLRIGNGAVSADGIAHNYWGMLVVPLALSLWPASTLLLVRRPVGPKTSGSAGSTGS